MNVVYHVYHAPLCCDLSIECHGKWWHTTTRNAKLVLVPCRMTSGHDISEYAGREVPLHGRMLLHERRMDIARIQRAIAFHAWQMVSPIRNPHIDLGIKVSL